MGQKFYGQFSNPKVDQGLFNKYFQNKLNGVFIEAGAYDGLNESSCKFFEETLGWSGINVEPDPSIYKKLTENRPNAVNLNVALRGQSDESFVEFNKVILPGCEDNGLGYLEHKDNTGNLSPEQRQIASFRKIQVPTIAYKELIHQNNISELDLFVLDIEGFELEFLNTLTLTDVLPSVFCIEFTSVGLDKLKNTLDSLGYSFDGVEHCNAHFTR